MNELEATKLISKRVMVSAINIAVFLLTIAIIMFVIGYFISEKLLTGRLVIAIALFPSHGTMLFYQT